MKKTFEAITECMKGIITDIQNTNEFNAFCKPPQDGKDREDKPEYCESVDISGLTEDQKAVYDLYMMAWAIDKIVEKLKTPTASSKGLGGKLLSVVTLVGEYLPLVNLAESGGLDDELLLLKKHIRCFNGDSLLLGSNTENLLKTICKHFDALSQKDMDMPQLSTTEKKVIQGFLGIDSEVIAAIINFFNAKVEASNNKSKANAESFNPLFHLITLFFKNADVFQRHAKTPSIDTFKAKFNSLIKSRGTLTFEDVKVLQDEYKAILGENHSPEEMAKKMLADESMPSWPDFIKSLDKPLRQFITKGVLPTLISRNKKNIEDYYGDLEKISQGGEIDGLQSGMSPKEMNKKHEKFVNLLIKYPFKYPLLWMDDQPDQNEQTPEEKISKCLRSESGINWDEIGSQIKLVDIKHKKGEVLSNDEVDKLIDQIKQLEIPDKDINQLFMLIRSYINAVVISTSLEAAKSAELKLNDFIGSKLQEKDGWLIPSFPIIVKILLPLGFEKVTGAFIKQKLSKLEEDSKHLDLLGKFASMSDEIQRLEVNNLDDLSSLIQEAKSIPVDSFDGYFDSANASAEEKITLLKEILISKSITLKEFYPSHISDKAQLSLNTMTEKLEALLLQGSRDLEAAISENKAALDKISNEIKFAKETFMNSYHAFFKPIDEDREAASTDHNLEPEPNTEEEFDEKIMSAKSRLVKLRMVDLAKRAEEISLLDRLAGRSSTKQRSILEDALKQESEELLLEIFGSKEKVDVWKRSETNWREDKKHLEGRFKKLWSNMSEKIKSDKELNYTLKYVVNLGGKIDLLKSNLELMEDARTRFSDASQKETELREKDAALKKTKAEEEALLLQDPKYLEAAISQNKATLQKIEADSKAAKVIFRTAHSNFFQIKSSGAENQEGDAQHLNLESEEDFELEIRKCAEKLEKRIWQTIIPKAKQFEQSVIFLRNNPIKIIKQFLDKLTPAEREVFLGSQNSEKLTIEVLMARWDDMKKKLKHHGLWNVWNVWDDWNDASDQNPVSADIANLQSQLELMIAQKAGFLTCIKKLNSTKSDLEARERALRAVKATSEKEKRLEATELRDQEAEPQQKSAFGFAIGLSLSASLFLGVIGFGLIYFKTISVETGLLSFLSGLSIATSATVVGLAVLVGAAIVIGGSYWAYTKFTSSTENELPKTLGQNLTESVNSPVESTSLDTTPASTPNTAEQSGQHRGLQTHRGAWESPTRVGKAQ